ncbi:MAG: hypothetical protein ACYC9J_00370 [Sulfuricaulis sp.]
MASMQFRRQLVGLMASLFACMAQADPTPQVNPTPVASKWHLALDYAHTVNYHEPGISESGPLYGLFLDWDTSPASRWTVVGNLMAASGNFNYDGKTQNGIPLMERNNDHLWMGELALGLHLGAAKNTTLYAGLGERYWTDVLGSNTTVSGLPTFGYRRAITYLYAPIGVRVGEPLGEHWRLEMDAKYMSLLHGRVQSHLEDINPNLSLLVNTQHKGSGYAFSLRFAHLQEENPMFSETYIEPYFQAWSVPHTDSATIYLAGVPDGSGYEPDNTTRIIGVRFGVTF